MIDQYFTPKHVADSSFVGLEKKSINTIADFAIGDGSLIQNIPVVSKNVIGIDIDLNIINGLKIENPKWDLCNDDFLNPRKETLRWLNKWEGKIDVVVLNPPFSVKGTKSIAVEFEGRIFNSRKALAFVLLSLKYLNKNGVLIAIIPMSCLKSEFDAPIIEYLKSRWGLVLGERFNRKSFVGCSPNSIVITLKRSCELAKITSTAKKIIYKYQVEIIRGWIPMYTTYVEGTYQVLHTTNLTSKETVKSFFRYTNRGDILINKAFLCIPRVGKPLKHKLIIINSKKKIALSDCIIAIKTTTRQELNEIKKIILFNWEKFESLYDSTCAPYITLSQLKDFFSSLDINSDFISRKVLVNLEIDTEDKKRAI